MHSSLSTKTHQRQGSVLCRVFSSILGLHPQGASSIPPRYDNQKCLQTLPKVPQREWVGSRLDGNHHTDCLPKNLQGGRGNWEEEELVC